MANKAEVKYNLYITNTIAIIDRIEDLGFKAKIIRDCLVDEEHDNIDIVQLTITGMTCASCVSTIETNLLQLKGIKGM